MKEREREREREEPRSHGSRVHSRASPVPVGPCSVYRHQGTDGRAVPQVGAASAKPPPCLGSSALVCYSAMRP
jgi:hypothetical protein